ncbi:MAG: hypothetical protein P1V18_06060 [Candidatus Gracilibacteria bacterium]|nr:hypothetical protein [Candidatus Gracilibacteria bacterium]
MNNPPSPLKEQRKTFYSKRAIGWVTFLTGPLSGAYMLAENFKNLGNEDAYRNTLITSLLATFFYFLGAFYLPENIVNILDKGSSSLINLPCLFVLVALQDHYQRKKIEQKIKNGAHLATGWSSFKIGVIGFFIFLSIGFAITMAYIALGLPIGE